MPLNTVFEKEVCGRCGGSGQYSYNQLTGSRCFGCGGKGERLTKRGAAASAFFRALNTKRAADVQVGDVMEVTTFGGTGTAIYYAPVVAVDTSEQTFITNDVRQTRQMIDLSTEHSKMGKSGLICGADTPVRVRPATEEVRQARIAEALGHQATLTKTGKPRKG